MNIRVRFAPSPTGYLHIGGARTALFNYLFAKNRKGSFLLRIEDTDTARSSREMTQQILRSLEWLGIAWDEDPVMQSANTDRHKQVCGGLYEKGCCYPCFCTKEELEQRRKESGSYRYDGTCRDLTAREQKQRMESGQPYILRFKVEPGETVFDDMVRGTVRVDNSEIDDFVILRSDSTPVYQIAVVVDDHDMGITHVVRGDDHISNTPKQILLYRAMGWDVPVFAHIPMILGPDKKRLSKRHGAASVEEYKDMGIMPEALVNYLALLGWSAGDDRELFSMEELARVFSIERIVKNPAVFDETRLMWFNGNYMRETPDEALLPLVRETLTGPQDVSDKYMLGVIALMKPRAATYKDIAVSGACFFKDPESYEEKAVKKHWKKEGVSGRLEAIVSEAQNTDVWDEASIESMIRGLAEKEGVGAGKYIHPVRLALAGCGQSPGLFEMMELLGKETVLRRISRAQEYVDSMSGNE